MAKLLLVPSRNYSAQDGRENIVTQLDGGAPRVRKDQANAWDVLDIEFDINAGQFDYLRAFYRQNTANGSSLFSLDLIKDNSFLEEYNALFDESGLRIVSQNGNQYVVTTRIFADKVVVDIEKDAAIILLYETYEADYVNILNIFAQIANVNMPEALS